MIGDLVGKWFNVRVGEQGTNQKSYYMEQVRIKMLLENIQKESIHFLFRKMTLATV